MMEMWLWVIIGILLFVIAALSVKIRLLKRAAEEIEIGFAEKLAQDTNTLIDISSRDKTMRRLAGSINTQLAALRTVRNCYQQGDLELRNAVTNISHDLRTPLTAICGYLDLLEEELAVPEYKINETSTTGRQMPHALHYLSIIRGRTEILKQLTEELFRYSIVLTTEHSANTETVDVNAVLEESVAAFYTDLTAHQITPSVSMPDERIIRALNRADLSRIFANLLNNALKYSDGDLQIALTAPCTVTFSNTASALNNVQVGRLFDRFYTVETARSSTGLGLSITRTLTERMGGTAEADYTNGRLTVRITFP